MMNKKMAYLLVSVIILLTMGCTFSSFNINRVAVGEMLYDSQTIELGDADEVRVDIRMGAGELKIDNRAESLMEADFTYNIESWTPIVTYNVEESKGRLTVRQPQTDLVPVVGNLKYEWDLRFSRDVPLEMRIDCGAGDHDIDLAELSVTSLDAKMGAGNVKIDLTDNPELSDMELDIGAGNVEIDLVGAWEKDVDVAIQGGVGRIVLLLPNDTGVRVNISKGIGNVDTTGLMKEGNTYTNAVYGETDAILDIEIQAGVGQIELNVSP